MSSNTLQIMRNNLILSENFFALFCIGGTRKANLLGTKFNKGFEYITVKFKFTSVSTDPVARLLS